MDEGFGAVEACLRADPARLACLSVLAALDLPDGWIGAGFVRNAVWDRLHGMTDVPRSSQGDVDVVWFDPSRATQAEDRRVEAVLRARCPGPDWQVRNQARMHRRHGHAPYLSTADAMRLWPETATAVAVRLTGEGRMEGLAPFGFGDLLGLRVVPTPAFAGARYPEVLERVRDKGWLERWPGLVVTPPRVS